MALLGGAVMFFCTANAYGQSHAATYYVDCNAGAGHGTDTGNSQAIPFRTLAALNLRTFHPGDRILFKRGSECKGMLTPHGSGANGNPIVIGAYGEGPRPKITARDANMAALELANQEYWEITSLEVGGGTTYGIFIKADRGLMHHIHLSELTVHDVGNGDSGMDAKASGLVVILATSVLGGFDDVLVDSVLASNTRQWSGIYISGGKGKLTTAHAAVRNSIVHDVQGDGIVLFHMRDGLIENSAAWRTGMQHTQSMGTPNAIWTWACDHCVVQNNEAFLIDSPGLDGGAFDIDFWNAANIIRGNYGHDTQGYCASVFGAFSTYGASSVTKGSVVSDNLCIRNGLSPRLARQQGAIFMTTWENGSIDGVRIQGNTVYWDAPGDFPAIQQGDDVKLSGLTIAGNTIYSTALPFVEDSVEYDGAPNKFVFIARGEAGSVPTLEHGSPVEVRQVKTGNVACWSGCAVPNGGGTSSARRLSAWLSSDVQVRAHELVMLKSQSLQFRDAGLRVVATCRCDAAEARQLSDDWHLAEDGVLLTGDSSQSTPQSAMVLTVDGVALRTWTDIPTIPGLGLALRQLMGEPVFGRMPSR
jgi:hypothetical protein